MAMTQAQAHTCSCLRVYIHKRRTQYQLQKRRVANYFPIKPLGLPQTTHKAKDLEAVKVTKPLVYCLTTKIQKLTLIHIHTQNHKHTHICMYVYADTLS